MLNELRKEIEEAAFMLVDEVRPAKVLDLATSPVTN
jgi:hypothetical protein